MADSLENSIEILTQEGFLEVRFLGAFSSDRFKGQVQLAVRACAERTLRLLLIDYTKLSPLPTTLERYQIGAHGAEIAGSLLKVAGLSTPEMASGEFGAIVARNRGLNVAVFTDRDKAVEWLMTRSRGRHGGSAAPHPRRSPGKNSASGR